MYSTLEVFAYALQAVCLNFRMRAYSISKETALGQE